MTTLKSHRPRVEEYLWTEGPRCVTCDGTGKAMTVSGLAFIVRCADCERQTEMERCEDDALAAWQKLNASRPDPRDPDHSRSGIFVHHNCWKCGSGQKPCVRGNPNGCDYSRARND